MKSRGLYVVDLDNNANTIVTSSKTKYCLKCGKKLDEDSLDRFCDSECRREYYTEIRQDINSFA